MKNLCFKTKLMGIAFVASLLLSGLSSSASAVNDKMDELDRYRQNTAENLHTGMGELSKLSNILYGIEWPNEQREVFQRTISWADQAKDVLWNQIQVLTLGGIAVHNEEGLTFYLVSDANREIWFTHKEISDFSFKVIAILDRLCDHIDSLKRANQPLP